MAVRVPRRFRREANPFVSPFDGITDMALTSRFETSLLTPLHWAAGALAAITGIIHLFLGVTGLLGTVIGTGLAVSFLLAGLGFFGGIWLGLIDYRRRLLYAVGIPYAAVQIILWYVANFDSVSDVLANAGPIEYVDKVVQVVLIVVLAVLYFRES